MTNQQIREAAEIIAAMRPRNLARQRIKPSRKPAAWQKLQLRREQQALARHLAAIDCVAEEA